MRDGVRARTERDGSVTSSRAPLRVAAKPLPDAATSIDRNPKSAIHNPQSERAPLRVAAKPPPDAATSIDRKPQSAIHNPQLERAPLRVAAKLVA